jgi:hypothetical protein
MVCFRLLEISMKILAAAMSVFIVSNLWAVRPQDKKAAPATPPNGAPGCPTPTQDGATLPEGGRVEENVYTNEFYGLRYEFPKSWHVDAGAIQLGADQKKKHESPPDPEDKVAHAVWQEIQCHHQLLVVSREPETHPWPGASHVGIPSVSLNINDLTVREDVKTPHDSSNVTTESPDEDVQIVWGPTDFVFDGQLFSRTDWKLTLPPLLDRTARTLPPGRIIYRASVAGVRNGHWILFLIHAESPQQLEDLFQTLQSLHFR